MLALKSFHDLIEDARAMLGGTYAQRLSSEDGEERRGEPPFPQRWKVEADQISFDPGIDISISAQMETRR